MVPAKTAVTIPESDPIVAMPVDPEYHVPPVGVSDKETVPVRQTWDAPEIAAGCGFTVMGVVTAQPLESI